MKTKVAAILAVVFLLLSIITGCGSNKPVNEAPVEDKYVPVETNKVKKEDISNLSTLSGKVFADKDVVIFPKVPGKVTSVSVKVGDSVKEGQVLFALDSEDAKKQVEQAQAALNMASSALNMAKANFELNNEKFENAKINLERTKILYENGAVSKAQYEAAQLQASDKQMDVFNAQLSQAQASYDQAQIAYNQALQSLDNMYVKSPINGIVSEVNVQAGTMTSSVQVPVSIVNMDIVNVQINVTQDIVKSLTLNQDVKVDISSASSNSFTGKIAHISPAADTRTQLYSVKINIDNKDKTIKPGMFAKVQLSTDTKQDAIIVKSEAVVEKDGKYFVYVVENDSAVEKEVTIGLDTGSFLEIKSGLAEGEKVIVKGQNYVENGTKVKIVRGDQ